jgi:hypothetical protein
VIRRLARGGLALACASLACASLMAGCGSQRSGTTSITSPPPVTAPLSTSLVTAQGTWAIAVMGRPADAHNAFWQLFVRPAGASRWSLVTPQGVADNGGLVAAGEGTSLVVGFRPSQSLVFSPLATSTDTGKSWTPGLVDAGLADTPGAIAIGPSGRTLALLQDGTITTAQMKGDGEVGGASAAGQWTPLTTLKALAASAPGRSCGLVGVSAVSFGLNKDPMVAGSCARPGVAGVFTDSGGTWRSAGLVLPAGGLGKGPGKGTVQVLGLAATADGNVALLAAGNSLLAAWWNGTRWTVSDPIAGSTVRALGFGAGGSAWLLLGGGHAETIGAGGSWQALPPVPSGTVTLAPSGTVTLAPPGIATLAPGTGGGYDALAVSGSKLTIWRLAQGGWAKVQVITVPIVYGSSG